jgi:hypothetical protein
MDFRKRRYFVVGVGFIPRLIDEDVVYGNHIVDIYKTAKAIPSVKIKYIYSMPRGRYRADNISNPRLLISCRREYSDKLIDILDSKFNEYTATYDLSDNEHLFQYKELCDRHTRKRMNHYKRDCIKTINEKLKNCYNIIGYALNEFYRSEDITNAIELLRKHNTTGASVIRLSNGKITERELINKILDSYELLADKFITCEKLLKSSNESIETLINMKV